MPAGDHLETRSAARFCDSVTLPARTRGAPTPAVEVSVLGRERVPPSARGPSRKRLCKRIASTPLSLPVLRVICGSTEKKVGRVHARGVIAAMADIQTIGDRPMCFLPREAVRPLRGSATRPNYGCQTIPIPIAGSSPQKTSCSRIRGCSLQKYAHLEFVPRSSPNADLNRQLCFGAGGGIDLIVVTSVREICGLASERVSPSTRAKHGVP